MLYYFKEGQNTYTVDFEEREKFLREKQDISRKLLKQARYAHALEVIKDALELCEGGSYEEDKRRLRPFKLTNLKNKSLCLWKSKKWRDMETTCRDYVDLVLGKVKKATLPKEGKIGPNAQTINLGETPTSE